MTDIISFTVGSRVLVINSAHKEFIGLYGYVTKVYNVKPEYVQTFGTNRFFRVELDQPVAVRGKIVKSGIFKKTDLNYAK